MSRCLALPHGLLPLPAYLPDATYGVVRAVDSADLEACGVPALVMNAYHLSQKPGLGVAAALGGLHPMTGWARPIVCDSGGFQAWSVLARQPKLGSVTDQGFHLRVERGGKLRLTPEKSIESQLKLGADVVMCLDQCTHADDPPETQRQAVDRTIAWARRCRAAFDEAVERYVRPDGSRPLLCGVIQGGREAGLREACAEALVALGCDLYGFGGWPLDSEGRLLTEPLAQVRALVPTDKPLHALGVGHPLNLMTTASLGYELFDCALPTRDARRGRLYQVVGQPAADHSDWLRMVFVTDERYIRSSEPVDPHCDCLTCRRYSRGYLHHLYRTNEAAFQRLCTMHNVRVLCRLCEGLQ